MALVERRQLRIHLLSARQKLGFAKRSLRDVSFSLSLQQKYEKEKFSNFTVFFPVPKGLIPSPKEMSL